MASPRTPEPETPRATTPRSPTPRNFSRLHSPEPVPPHPDTVPQHNEALPRPSNTSTLENGNGYQNGYHHGDSTEKAEMTNGHLRNGSAPMPYTEKSDADQATARRRKSKYEGEDPFGDEEGNDVKYRTLEWWQASMIMIAETISLGILSLPSVLATIGLVPGIILIAGLGIIATYSGYVIGQFKMAYPHIHNMGDAGEVLLGTFGREFFGAAQVIFLIFSMSSHILTFTIAFNRFTGHATCTIVWAVVGLVVFWLFDLPRTLKNVSFLSIASFISIFSAVIITMVALGVDHPSHLVISATVPGPFAPAFLAVTDIIFAYAGHVAFFSFISEFKDPTEFPKALFLLQFVDVSLYILIAVVVYRYAGTDVASPALGSTSLLVSKVAYGIALPTIVIAGVIYGHVAAKYVYVRIFRGTKHMAQRTWLSFGTWAGITLVFWVIAFIIAESIPDFNELLSLISALFASWFTYGISGVFWLFMNWGQLFKGPRKIFLTFVNIGLFLLGLAICGIGLYASGKAIHEGSHKGSWSCAGPSSG